MNRSSAWVKVQGDESRVAEALELLKHQSCAQAALHKQRNGTIHRSKKTPLSPVKLLRTAEVCAATNAAALSRSTEAVEESLE